MRDRCADARSLKSLEHKHVDGLAFGTYWLTMVLASVFLYGTVLTLQGTLTLLLPRFLSLRVSAVLQIVAYIVLLGMYFLSRRCLRLRR